jgi:hypothetical protein
MHGLVLSTASIDAFGVPNLKLISVMKLKEGKK